MLKTLEISLTICNPRKHKGSKSLRSISDKLSRAASNRSFSISPIHDLTLGFVVGIRYRDRSLMVALKSAAFSTSLYHLHHRLPPCWHHRRVHCSGRLNQTHTSPELPLRSFRLRGTTHEVAPILRSVCDVHYHY